jgi:DNA-binding transcriptional MerR regulator
VENEEFLIHELAEKAGVTVRTIRYYTIEGLLPPPISHGKFAYYTKDHLHRLELIRQLKDAYLPLREIRQTMSSMSDAEVQQRLPGSPPDLTESGLKETAAPAVPQGGTKALDYISQLMERQSSLRKVDVQPPLIREPQPLYASPPVEETWRRIELAPGVELHIRQPIQALPVQTIQQITAALRSLLQTKA